MSPAADRLQPPVRTFAFVDLAGFTALTEVHGDDEAVEQVERFVDLTRAALGPEDQLIKTLGDAVMVGFDTPGAALHALRRLLLSCHGLESLPMPRAGLHHGPAVERAGDWFGATVNLAARVTAQAKGGQTLATAEVAQSARSEAIAVVELGCFTLRNVTGPVELFELGLVPPTDAISLDPVCRMQVAHDRAAGQLRHNGRNWWFCSLRCAHDFSADPNHYTMTS